LRGAGTGCDVFQSHGREHVVRDGAATPSSTPGGEARLAGSALSQLEMVRRLVHRGVLSAGKTRSRWRARLARALGIEREACVLAPGAHADFLGARAARRWSCARRSSAARG
jgi:N-acetylglucosamine-6-phosphate deacetylase